MTWHPEIPTCGVLAFCTGGPNDGQLRAIERLSPTLTFAVYTSPSRRPGLTAESFTSWPYKHATYVRGAVDPDFKPFGSVYRYWWVGTK